MKVRVAIYVCVSAFFVALVAAQERQPAKVANNDPGWISRNNKAWQALYHPNEVVHEKVKRQYAAVRVRIRPDGTDYVARLRWFDANVDGSGNVTSYKPIVHNPTDPTQNSGGKIDLRIAAADVNGAVGPHRKRVSFVSEKGDYHGREVQVKGVWQRGKNKGSTESQRMQLYVIFKPPYTAKAKEMVECEEEPDSDVLEEEHVPDDDDDTPPDDPP